MLPLLPLPLKDPVGLLPELLGGGAVALRSAGGQLLGEGRRQSRRPSGPAWRRNPGPGRSPALPW